MKQIAAKLFATIIFRRNQKWIKNPIESQEKTFQKLIATARETTFGRDHNFRSIKTPADFFQFVPIRDYEELSPYIDRMVAGEENILWPGKPIYFSKTSGTTSGAKYIPITKESMPTHITAARDALLNYIYRTGKTGFLKGKQIFIQGSPKLEDKNGVALGRLSGIVAHYVPRYLQKSRMPSWETNCIEDWEHKVDTIVEETLTKNMTLIGGIPSWVQMYFEKLKKKTNKNVGDIFKDFSLLVYGGVNFEPYKSVFNNLIGRKVDTIELFPASEGFFAYQDLTEQDGLLLLLNNDIFYEFIRVDQIQQENPKRYLLHEIELGVNYAFIISTSAGLWAYNIGDTVLFVSKTPFRLVVTGRIKHFISAFGEHVIGKEVETALKKATEGTDIRVREFTVAPQVKPEKGLPYHEWCIEFDLPPNDIEAFEKVLDQEMEKQNVYYQDLIQGKVLRKLVIKPVAKQGFEAYMKSIGKLGGQNKVPRLSNDRKIADALQKKD
ncbi:MAG: hypothetical protein CMP52_05190 [Flavobacteriales bacterium]|nr:hypothetical protein [Candidatus Arcticimaribacter sp.]